MQISKQIYSAVILFTLLAACGESKDIKPAMRSQDPPGELTAFDPVATYEKVHSFAGPESELVSMYLSSYINPDGTLDLTRNRLNEEILQLDRRSIRAEYTFIRPFTILTHVDSSKLRSDTEGRIGERVVTKEVHAKASFPYEEVKIYIQYKLTELPEPYFQRQRLPAGYSYFKDMLEYSVEGVKEKRGVISPLKDFTEMLKQALKEAGSPDSSSIRMSYSKRGISFTVLEESPFMERTGGSARSGYYTYKNKQWNPIVTVDFDKNHKIEYIKKAKK